MKVENLCINCMREKKVIHGRCEYCGYNPGKGRRTSRNAAVAFTSDRKECRVLIFDNFWADHTYYSIFCSTVEVLYIKEKLTKVQEKFKEEIQKKKDKKVLEQVN